MKVRHCAGCRKETCDGCGLWKQIENPKGQEMIFPEGFQRDKGQGLGITFDVGTTTVAAVLWDLAEGKQLGAVTEVNAQRFAGSDVVSRIVYYEEGPEHAKRLKAAITKQLDRLAQEVSGGREIQRAVVVGNTAMCQILLGISLEGLTRAPFHKGYEGSRIQQGKELGFVFLQHTRLIVLPAIQGFVGADALAVYTIVKKLDGRKGILAVDIGTNGEILLFGKEHVYACSAAAGPALEGAAAAQGMGACAGAIRAVGLAGGFPRQELACQVIGGQKAKGICGSGLLSALALLLKLQIIDQSGYLKSESEARRDGAPQRICTRIREGKEGRSFLLWEGEKGQAVRITAADVRQLQLAIAAIRSGIDLVLEKAETKKSDLAGIYLAGSFGSSLSAEDAVEIGLLPEAEGKLVSSIGSAAGMGACLALFSEKVVREMEEDAGRILHVELADEKNFQERFLEAMTLKRR